VLEEGGRDVLEAPEAAPPFRVIFEDDALLVVNKPPGVTAQPTAGRVGDSLLDEASSWLKKPAGLVHRLDRETSGVTVFGKTPEATSALAAQFREGRVEKVYLAVTGPGLEASGEVDLPIGRDPSHPGRQRAQKGAMGKKAFTRFERLTAQPHFCVVRLFPKTGRTHQLRAHLTALGFPILGDRLYRGAPVAGALEAPRCLLHARSLTLVHPTTQAKLTFEAPVFEDMAVFLKAVPGLF
jgi:23S rRNA pseudouridine1911/1915/1917 synthase